MRNGPELRGLAPHNGQLLSQSAVLECELTLQFQARSGGREQGVHQVNRQGRRARSQARKRQRWRARGSSEEAQPFGASWGPNFLGQGIVLADTKTARRAPRVFASSSTVNRTLNAFGLFARRGARPRRKLWS